MYNCGACAANPGLKQMLGHDGPPQNYWTTNLITGEALERCPLRTLQLAPRTLDAELFRYTELYYPAYQDKHLLVEGGIADQPARYLELVQLTARYERLAQAKYDSLTADTEGDA
jgi:hypothetical protein